MTDILFSRHLVGVHSGTPSDRTPAPVSSISQTWGILPELYAMLNRTAVLMQELQRVTQLNADELLTLATIAMANLQRWHRTAGCKGARLTTVNLVPTSQSALARATGTPRQTMRRRLEKLIAIGAVRLTPQGLIIDFDNPTVVALMQRLPVDKPAHVALVTANVA